MSKTPSDTLIAGQIRKWDAWWSADPDRLTTVYGSEQSPLVRPSQMAGGLVGRVSRWFWGAPAAPGEETRKVHLPVAKIIARKSARLLFGETLTITEPESTSEAVAARHTWLHQDANLDTLLMRAAETCAALGGVYLALTWDDSVTKRPIPFAVRPDAADPVFGPGGMLREVTFTTRLGTQADDKDGVVWRHKQRYLPKEIEHRLYKGKENELGEERPLDDHTATAGITATYLTDQGRVRVITGAPGLAAVYVPNIVSDDGDWARHPVACHYGRSDFDGIEGIFDQIDRRLTGLGVEFDNGEGRAVVPVSWLDHDPGQPGTGALFNLNQRVFTGLDIDGKTADGQKMEVLQFDLRTEAFWSTIDSLFRKAVTMAGYSPATFGLDEQGGAVTAAEVKARQADTLETREAKTRLWTPALVAFLEAFYAVDAYYWGEAGGGATRPTVIFPAAVTPSPQEKVALVSGMASSESASVRTRVKEMHPDWDDKTVDAEVALIYAETSRQVVALDDVPA